MAMQLLMTDSDWLSQTHACWCRDFMLWQHACSNVNIEAKGGGNSGHQHIRWDRRTTTHQNDPGTAQEAFLTVKDAGELRKSRGFFFLAVWRFLEETVAKFGGFQLAPPK
jgi:hypothetical protein